MAEVKSLQPSDCIRQSSNSPALSRIDAARPPALGPKGRTDGIEPRNSGSESRPDPRPPIDRSREATTIPPPSSSTGRDSRLLWLGRRPLDTQESDDGLDRGLTRARGEQEDHAVTKKTPGQRHDRVATALDRMGAGVVEVRDAFQRWVPWRREAEATRDTRNHTAAVATSSAKNEKHEISGSIADDLEEAMVNAMVELRIPQRTAQAFCEGVAAGASAAEGDTVSFSDFVGRYADAAGLLREKTSTCRPGGGVWAEGPGGVWVEVSRRELAGAKDVFDEAADKQVDKRRNEGIKVCAKPA